MSIRKQHEPRVLMLIENSVYPGDPRVRRQSRALRDAGYRVSVIAPMRRGEAAREVVEGIEVFRFPAPPPGNGFLGYLVEYGYSMAATLVLSARALIRPGFDVIHAANPPDTFFLVAAPFKLLGKKFVYDHHDLAPEMYYARFGGKGSRTVYRVLTLMERLSCKLADHVIATNESYKEIEMTRGGVPESSITIVRNGPELDRYRQGRPDPALREEGKTVITFAGIMGYQDGVDYLVRALRHLKHDLGRSDFICYMVGGRGEARDELKAMVREYGLEEHVRFTGWVSDDDWVRYLCSADVCVAPDPSNPFTDRSTMIKVTEYMAAGKPVVAFDLPEHRRSAGDAALYVRPNDEMEYARAIVQLMDDPERRRTMGEYGQQRVERKLDWRYSAERLVGAYRRMLGRSVPQRVKVPGEHTGRDHVRVAAEKGKSE
jgi:glycosyltransferase involved in cell wall biosynthesis